MKTKVTSSLKILLPFLLMTAICMQASAQKKDVQPTNLRAPEGIKIDGKLNEWGFDFQAYNKTTKLYYTMANDDKNLYLVVKIKDKLDITKALGGGISLLINTADKKKDKDAFTITFPMPPPRASGGGRNGMRGMRGGNQSSQTPEQIDSASRANHKAALGLIREIGILGFKDITDSTISIYNEYGIKAAAGFDDEDAFISELSIPLKLLALSADDPKEFAYNITANAINSGKNRGGGDGGGFNGGGEGGLNGGGFGGGRNGGGGGGGFGGGGGGFGGGGGGRNGGGGGGGGRLGGGNSNGITNMEELMTATDFWGKYTLAKSTK